jgi:hypothetical protein
LVLEFKWLVGTDPNQLRPLSQTGAAFLTIVLAQLVRAFTDGLN